MKLVTLVAMIRAADQASMDTPTLPSMGLNISWSIFSSATVAPEMPKAPMSPPEMTTAAYRMGDSSLVIMSPMNPYFILVLGFAQRWRPGLGVGGLLSTLLPYAVAFFVAGLVVTGVWAALGLATGPAAPFHYLIPS